MSTVSLILFSGDYDRSMAALTIANGAAGEGDRVAIFFTFWGISLIRQKNGSGANFLQKIFKRLMPVGPNGLGLSRLNFAGLGPILLRRLIRQKNGQTLSDLLAMAVERGIELIACQASLELLGLSRRELLDTDRLRIGDVHEFLAIAKGSEICLFV